MEKIKGRVISDGFGMGILTSLGTFQNIEQLVGKKIYMPGECHIEKEIEILRSAAKALKATPAKR